MKTVVAMLLVMVLGAFAASHALAAITRVEWDGNGAPNPSEYTIVQGAFATDTPSAGYATQSGPGQSDYVDLAAGLNQANGWRLEWGIDVQVVYSGAAGGITTSDDVSAIFVNYDLTNQLRLATGSSLGIVPITPGHHDYVLERAPGGTAVRLFIDGTLTAVVDASSGPAWTGIWFGTDSGAPNGMDAVWDYVNVQTGIEVARLEWDGTGAPWPAEYTAQGPFAYDSPSAGFATQSGPGQSDYVMFGGANLIQTNGWQIEWGVDVQAVYGPSAAGLLSSDDVSSLYINYDNTTQLTLTTGSSSAVVPITTGHHDYILRREPGSTDMTLLIDSSPAAVVDASSVPGWAGMWFGTDTTGGSGLDAVWDYVNLQNGYVPVLGTMIRIR